MENISPSGQHHLRLIIEKIIDQKAEASAKIELEEMLGKIPFKEKEKYPVAYLMYAGPIFVTLATEYVSMSLALEIFQEFFIDGQIQTGAFGQEPGPLFLTEKDIEESNKVRRSEHCATDYINRCAVDCYTRNSPTLFELIKECSRLLLITDPPAPQA